MKLTRLQVYGLIDAEIAYGLKQYNGRIPSVGAALTLCWKYYRRIEAAETACHPHSEASFEARGNLRKIAALLVGCLNPPNRGQYYAEVDRQCDLQDRSSFKRDVIDELTRIRCKLGEADSTYTYCLAEGVTSNLIALCVGLMERWGAPERRERK